MYNIIIYLQKYNIIILTARRCRILIIDLCILCLCFPVFPGAVDRRDSVATAQRGPPNRNHEHETGTGSQVPGRSGPEVGKLRGVHALRPLSRRPNTRCRTTQPRPRKQQQQQQFFVRSVLNSRSTVRVDSVAKSVHFTRTGCSRCLKIDIILY